MNFEMDFSDRAWSIETIDMHTGGEPLRIINKGLPAIKGKSILEKIQYFKSNHDHLRTRLMWEPRGHADMYGAVIVPAVNSGSLLGVFFLHNEGYSSMCGHAIIAITTLVAKSEKLVGSGKKEFQIDVPSGKVTAGFSYANDKADRVSFINVPSYVVSSNNKLDLDHFGEIRYDIAFGGAFYAYINADELGLDLKKENGRRIIDLGKRIKALIKDEITLKHPFDPALEFLYGVIFYGSPQNGANESKNVCIFANGELDRSATGTGVSGKAAILFHKGVLKIGEPITIESITGSTMTVSIKETIAFGPFTAVLPEVSGNAYITGYHKFYFDPEDPFLDGFFIR